MLKLWVDDIRTPPSSGYIWAKSTNEAITMIQSLESLTNEDESGLLDMIDIDHDAGSYASDGGDYIKILDWMEETGRKYPIRIHSMNPVGVNNMRAIIQHNGWTEVK